MTLEQYFTERNSSKSTILTYTRSVRYYEKLTGHTLDECIEIADKEETDNIRWKNTQTREWILTYRQCLYNNYNISTAQLYLRAIIAIYRHYEINIPPLPYFSKKGLNQTPPINYSDLPDRDILRACIQTTTPLIRSIILFMSSSGVSRIDTINLTIQDYLEATSEYHNHMDSIKYAIQDMENQDIIPTFHLRRQKTGINYFTFCSPEAVKSINSYLLTRHETLSKNKPLFKIHERYINRIFEQINTTLNLGKVGNYNRLRPHMLRKFNASQLAESGMSTDHINLLQGRKVSGVAHEHYIRIKPETLREEYIEALPYLVIEDINQYKTENQQLKEENEAYKNNLDELWAELNNMKKRTSIWEEMKQ